MSIRESQGIVNRALEELMVHWDRTRGAWRDQRAREFQRHVLDPLEGGVRQASITMERMADNIRRAQRECADLGNL